MDREKVKNEIFDIAFNGLSKIEKDIIAYPCNNQRRMLGKRTVPRKLIKKIQRKMYKKNNRDLFNYLDKIISEDIENKIGDIIERMPSYESV